MSALVVGAFFLLLSGHGHGPTAAAGEPSLVVLTPVVSAGTVTPDGPGQMAMLSASLTSGQDWRLSLARDTGAGLKGGRGRAAAAQGKDEYASLEVMTAGGQWLALQPGLPVPVASGGATAATGYPINLQLRVTASLDVPAGDCRVPLRFYLNEQPVFQAVECDYTIPVVTRMDSDPRPFALSSKVDPTKPSRYSFEPRIYKVYSNVPWVLEVTLKGPLTQNGTQTALRDDAISFSSPGAPPVVLSSGKATQVATGPMSGSNGASVELDFTYSLQGLVLQGDYSTSIDVDAKPAASSVSPVTAR